MRGPLLVVAGILFSLFGALGCAQGVGGRCVQNSDCQSGICSVNGPQGGVCLSNTTVITPSGTGGSGGAAGSGGVGGAAGSGGVGDSGGAGGAGGAGLGDAAVTNDGAVMRDAAVVSDAAGGHGGSSVDAQVDSASDR